MLKQLKMLIIFYKSNEQRTVVKVETKTNGMKQLKFY